jgi:hypothetical protein
MTIGVNAHEVGSGTRSRDLFRAAREVRLDDIPVRALAHP